MILRRTRKPGMIIRTWKKAGKTCTFRNEPEKTGRFDMFK